MTSLRAREHTLTFIGNVSYRDNGKTHLRQLTPCSLRVVFELSGLILTYLSRSPCQSRSFSNVNELKTFRTCKIDALRAQIDGRRK